MCANFTKAVPIIDRKKMLKNIETMAKKAEKSGVIFRPHFKTHQSAGIGKLYRQFNITQISVSSVDMAEYFSSYGWDDISICVPVNINQIKRINNLARDSKIHLLVENSSSAIRISDHLTEMVNIWIEIDTGYNRTGAAWNNDELILDCASILSQSGKISFMGILTHAGHSYLANSVEEIKEIHFDTMKKMRYVKKVLEEAGYSDIRISIGDTPTCSVIESFDSDVTEIRPGNFVFYDLKQYSLGSCSIDQIAVGIIAPIIALHPERNEFVIHCGGVHLSKDSLVNEQGKTYFGLVAKQNEDGSWNAPMENTYIRSLSQEHGIVKAPSEVIDSLIIGDILIALPIHACLAVNHFPFLYWMDGQPIRKFIYDLE